MLKYFLKGNNKKGNNIISIANTHLYAKNQKKLMMKSRENAQKPVFPAYFRHFQLEKNFF